VTVLTRNRAAASAAVRNVACAFGAGSFVAALDSLRRTRTRSGFTVSHHSEKLTVTDSRLAAGARTGDVF
jgi:hypothetical protein